MKTKLLHAKKMLLVTMFVILLSIVGTMKMYAQNFTFGNLNYSINTDGTTVTVTGHVDGTSATGSLIIPESVTYEDMEYAVTSIGSGAFDRCSGFTGSLTIPNSVTLIGYYAFSFCDGFTGSLTIPYSVTSIETGAFEGCSRWEQIEVAPENPFYDSRNDCNAIIHTNTNELLSGCMNTTIPNTVTTIGEYAFNRCSGLTTLTIPNSVTEIKSGAFLNCSSLTTLNIPNSVTEIGDWAFKNCSNLTSAFVLAETPPSLGYDVFGNVNMGIPVYVLCGSEDVYASTSWGGFRNFYEMCAGEIAVTANPSEGGMVIGAGYYEGGTICSITATANEGYSFINWTKNGAHVSFDANCSIVVAGDASYEANFAEGINITFTDANVKALCVANWDTNSDGELSYSEAAAVTDLGEVFRSNSTIMVFDELRYFVGLTSIGNNAFRSCQELNSIIIPSTVNSIEKNAFLRCTSLTSIAIPNSVTSIEEYAFQLCSGLTSIAIPSSVISIGLNPFMGCGGLEQIIVDPKNHEYDSRENCNAIIKTSTNELVTGCNNTVLLNSIFSIGSNAFCSCDDLTSITIPSSVTSIKSYAFQSCAGLTSIVIPSTITSIESNPFVNCSGLVQVVVDSGNPEYDSRENCNAIIKTSSNELVTGCKNTVIPNSVTSIGSSAFGGCTGLTLLAIPTSLTTIGNSAFSSCSGLISLTIPRFVTEIGWNAFSSCVNLTSITVLAETPPSVGTYAFLNVNPDILVTVPCGYASVYESSDWHNYFTTIEEDCGPHDVTIDENSMNGGNVSSSVTSTELGEEVQINITPDEGMMLASLIVSNANDPAQTIPVYSIGKNSLIYGFLMPPFDVIITATFGPVTAISENNETLALVYPNPTNGQIKIEAEDLKHITISNMLGQIVYDSNASGNEFEYDFSNRETGIYLIRIETAKGVAVKKVSVTR